MPDRVSKKMYNVLFIDWSRAELQGQYVYNIVVNKQMFVELRHGVECYDLCGNHIADSKIDYSNFMSTGSLVFEVNMLADLIDETVIKKMKMIKY